MNKYYSHKKEKYSWKTENTPNYTLYYLSGSKAEQNLKLVKKEFNSAIERAKEITYVDSIKTPIYYFLVDDREEFRKLTKLTNTGVSYTKSNTIIESYFLLGQSHEVVHLISHQNWGDTRLWISEGLSVYSDDMWSGKKIDTLCVTLHNENRLIPVKHLMKRNSFKKHNVQVAYPQSGSIIKYLIKMYGWDNFLKFWKKPNIKKIYKLTDQELEQDWLNNIKPLLKN